MRAATLSSAFVRATPPDAGHPVAYLLPIPRFFSDHRGVGGHVAHAGGMIGGLAQCGFEVTVLAEESHPVFDRDGVTVRLCPARSSSTLERQRWAPAFIRATRDEVRVTPPLFAYIRYSVGFCPWLSRLRRALEGVPLVIEVNSFAAQDRWWMGWIERRALEMGDLIVCVSERVQDLVRARLGPGLFRRSMVVPNAVDTSRFGSECWRERRTPDELRIGYAGILKPGYGLELLVDTFAAVRGQVPQAVLHVYGDGPLRGELEARAARCEGILFHGAVPFLDMPRVLAGLDIAAYTMAPETSFGSSTKVYEYMAAGLPIVAADTPGVRQALGDGEHGLLYPLGDGDALVRQIVRLAHDPGLARTLAQRGRDAVNAHHSWTARVQSLTSEMQRRGLIRLD
ncbi:MAG TPA: glycosyltransferase family 4 protein [Armatimonadota bacterium]|nr:glycosyltransferase family 4 protein [Armatimonadota bacterium]HQK93221.1 glycosyltransferase family 4 protein [Armatimonadota bacterium]